jgi:hypothetical protein
MNPKTWMPSQQLQVSPLAYVTFYVVAVPSLFLSSNEGPWPEGSRQQGPHWLSAASASATRPVAGADIRTVPQQTRMARARAHVGVQMAGGEEADTAAIVVKGQPEPIDRQEIDCLACFTACDIRACTDQWGRSTGLNWQAARMFYLLATPSEMIPLAPGKHEHSS